MIAPLCALLAGRRVILASTSPRRKQILENISFPVDVVPSKFEENLDKESFTHPWQYAVENSKLKALDVAQRLQDRKDWAVILGADTVVVLEGALLEKPGNALNATKMLQNLSGRKHLVYTGVALVYRSQDGTLHNRCFHEETEVTFATLSDDIIQSYVASNEPLDKAGAYGIQGLGATLVQGINGDYYNVVGLPLHRVCVELMDVLAKQN